MSEQERTDAVTALRALFVTYIGEHGRPPYDDRDGAEWS
jgi:hypothetical protein